MERNLNFLKFLKYFSQYHIYIELSFDVSKILREYLDLQGIQALIYIDSKAVDKLENIIKSRLASNQEQQILNDVVMLTTVSITVYSPIHFKVVENLVNYLFEAHEAKKQPNKKWLSIKFCKDKEHYISLYDRFVSYQSLVRIEYSTYLSQAEVRKEGWQDIAINQLKASSGDEFEIKFTKMAAHYTVANYIIERFWKKKGLLASFIDFKSLFFYIHKMNMENNDKLDSLFKKALVYFEEPQPYLLDEIILNDKDKTFLSSIEGCLYLALADVDYLKLLVNFYARTASHELPRFFYNIVRFIQSKYSGFLMDIDLTLVDKINSIFEKARDLKNQNLEDFTSLFIQEFGEKHKGNAHLAFEYYTINEFFRFNLAKITVNKLKKYLKLKKQLMDSLEK